MTHLTEYVLPAAELTQEAFRSRFPDPVLLSRGDETPSESDWRFRTQTISIVSAAMGRKLAEQGVSLSRDVAGYRVYPLVKTQNNPWRERISVGRARNNDIALLDSSVSKLHAHIHMSASAPPLLQDSGSRNGTMINGKKLHGDEKLPLTSGDKIVIGRVELVYLDAGGLFDFLVKHLERTGRA